MMRDIYIQTFSSPVGPLVVGENNGSICFLRFGEIPDGFQIRSTPLLKDVGVQLSEYFSGHRKHFEIPLAPCGTPFQVACWNALLSIPYGETRSYAQQAAAVGKPRAFRAVGMANHVNPIPILIPCHRVIGSNGKLTGYAGGLYCKRFLLELEAKYV